MVNLTIATTLVAPGKLTLKDVTSDADWAAAKLDRNQVQKYLVTASYPGRNGFTTETSGLPAAPMRQGTYAVTAGELVANGVSASCGYAGAFLSGCLSLKIQAVNVLTQNRYPTNYTVRLTAPLPAGGQLWVKKEGIWTEVTCDGYPEGSGWQWQETGSLDEYTDWVLRVNGVSATNGTVLKQVLGTNATARTVVVPLGVATLTLFMAASERVEWAEKMRKLLQEKLSTATCDPTPQYPAHMLSGYPVDDCRQGKLAYIGQLLDLLEKDVDCETGNLFLKRIRAELKAWN
ncbi:hypothetical protein [Spirosoma sordidisoli]|uniref:Uncharacterized protein n=1 Tax=Spirosoma sordidisoli TaxID=2502893 RepID=A0A4Q2USH2_9BACT|nr:hypothetical protein [Spirosoma sordidisoli]RYC70660.1 hypothetical protein EQG79_00480 [Spirosoma sordidisoli]